WLAATITSVALAGLSQWLVTRVSAGPVMALGMALIAGGILWATQVPVHGQFWSALAGPVFVAGAGTAFAFIPLSIAVPAGGPRATAGVAGVAGRGAGPAAGLPTPPRRRGGAMGAARPSTVAPPRLTTLLGQGKPVSVALTGGFQWGLWACAAIALLALPVT